MVPPVADKVAEYDVPAVPAGSEVVTICRAEFRFCVRTEEVLPLLFASPP